MSGGIARDACRDTSLSKVLLADVKEKGFAVAEALVDGGLCDAMADECRRMFEDDSNAMTHEAYSTGQSTRCELANLDPVAYPHLRAFYQSPLLMALVRDFFGDGALAHRTIYALNDRVGSELPVHQLHYDKMRHLKSFLYLTDVSGTSGPFVCVPGSHCIAQARERERRSRRVVPEDRQTRQLPSSLAEGEIEVHGRRGTLIVFDSDIAHRASQPLAEDRLSTRSLSFGAYRREVWFTGNGEVEHIDRREGVFPVR